MVYLAWKARHREDTNRDRFIFLSEIFSITEPPGLTPIKKGEPL